MLDPLFWPTVATALPILALAIVVEARTTISRWNDNYPPRVLRTAQGIFWIAPLILFLYLEPTAFEALEGSKVSHTSVSLVAPTVSLSLAVLIASPAAELAVRSNARILARILIAFPRARIRWIARRNVRNARKLVRTIKMAQSEELVNSVRLRKIESQIRSRDLPDDVDIEQMSAEAVNLRGSIDERRSMLEQNAQRANDLLSEAMSIRERSKGPISQEVINELETAITQLDFGTTSFPDLANESASGSTGGDTVG